jgi:hypothetical protein
MEWRDIVGFDCYQVSEYGDIRRKGSRLLQPVSVLGYKRVGLRKDGKTYNKSVHRLVAEAFIAESYGRIVRHKDGSRHNNHYRNLAYGTHQDNNFDRFKHGKRNANNTSGFTGAYETRDGTWQSRVRICGELIYLGTFATAEDAATAYDDYCEAHPEIRVRPNGTEAH